MPQPKRQEEYIVLVDDTGREIGTAPKLASHHSQTPLHKAFSCYIFDTEGRLLITQRAHTKKVWPGVWTNSVCGHPMPGESDTSAILRRAHDEIGLAVCDIAVAVPHYRYKTPPFNGITENEICPVYLARANGDLHLNPGEVSSYNWMSWLEYVTDIATRPDSYSYWAKDQLKQLEHTALLAQYTTT